MLSITEFLQPECHPPHKSPSSQKKLCIHTSGLPLHVTYDRYSTMHSLCCVTSVFRCLTVPDGMQGCTVLLCLYYTCKNVVADFYRCTEGTAKSTNQGFNRHTGGKNTGILCMTAGYRLQQDSCSKQIYLSSVFTTNKTSQS